MSLEEDLDFSGQRVLVTGAANGFGASIASAFAQQGAALVLADIEEAPLRAIADRLGGKRTFSIRRILIPWSVLQRWPAKSTF